MPQEIRSSGFPINLDAVLHTNCPPGHEDIILDRFRAYVRVIHGRQFHFSGPDRQTGEVRDITVPAANTSRYTQEGRATIKRKLSKRLGYARTVSVLLTLTVDPKRYTKSDAWETIWSAYAAFRRALWKHLKAHDWTHNPRYVAVLEQHKSGYPHLHVCYPGLRYLAPKDVINACWHMGSTHVKGSRRHSPGVLVSALAYVLKYVTKLSGWTEDGLAHLWHARARLYNISPKLYALPKPPKALGWQLTRIVYTDETLRDTARHLARLRFFYKQGKEVAYVLGQIGILS